MNLKISLEALNAFFTKHPARFFLLAALLWVALMCFLNYKDGANFQWHDILVEANGMAFDLLVFGILLSMYEALKEKREKIERLHEEIDDYRGWDEKEAMFRIVGAIKRLNNVGVSEMNLSDCFLSGANLRGANLFKASLYKASLSEADLSEANLYKANLYKANLNKANLYMANLYKAKISGAKFLPTYFWTVSLSEANLSGANLSGADLSGADLSGVNLWEANLSGANLRGANLCKASLYKAILSEVDLSEVDLSGALVGDDWFEKLDNWQVIGCEVIKQKYQINEEGRLIKNTPPAEQ